MSNSDIHYDGTIASEQLFGPEITRHVAVSAMRRRVILAMVVSDLVAIACAFTLAAVIAAAVRHALLGTPLDAMPFLVGKSLDLGLLAALLVGVLAFGGLYSRAGWELEEIPRIVTAVALVALFDTSLQYFLKDHSSRLWFVFAWPLVAVSIVGFRMLLRSSSVLEHAMMSHVLLIGGAVSAADFLSDTRESRSGAVRVLEGRPMSMVASLGPDWIVEYLERMADLHQIHPSRIEIVLAPSSDEHAEAQRLIDTLNQMGLPFSVALGYSGLAKRGLRLHSVIGADLVLAEVAASGTRQVERSLKRAIDVVASIFLLAFLAPLLLLIALLLMLEGRSVLFLQRRVGFAGRRFWCLKFRTMRPDAEDRLARLLESDAAAAREWAQYQKLSKDPRITRLGQILRATSLDELPQLLNVLVGDMSLVGPRPIVAPEVPGYDADHAYFRSEACTYYCSFRPGITGLWQVSGRARTRHNERIRLDAWYARNWSIWLDIVILLKTFRAVLARTGT